MIRCSPRHPMRWNAAIGAIARCKSMSTGCGRKRRSVRVWRSICGVKPTPKAVNKPSPHFIVHELDKPGGSATVSKNVAHTVTMVFMVYAAGTIGWWICGFALMFGGLGAISTLGGSSVLDTEVTLPLFGKAFGLFGGTGFFLSGATYDVGVFGLFLFQKVFMDTANYIPTGAMAERWKYLSFFLYTLFMSMFLYPIFGNWVWGGGWLSQLGVNYGLGHGHVDFAGSSVVHMVGGVCALAGAISLGPRTGKYTQHGVPVPIPGHNIPMA